MNNSRILTIKNAKFSGHYFYMNLNIWGDFRICISVPLSLYYLHYEGYYLHVLKVRWQSKLRMFLSNSDLQCSQLVDKVIGKSFKGIYSFAKQQAICLKNRGLHVCKTIKNWFHNSHFLRIFTTSLWSILSFYQLCVKYFIAWKFRGHFNLAVFWDKIAFCGSGKLTNFAVRAKNEKSKWLACLEIVYFYLWWK